MKKRIFTLDVDGQYNEEIKALCIPYQALLAEKIGASYTILTRREFSNPSDPSKPAISDKFRLYKLAQEEDTWTWFLDIDAMVHPDAIDFTSLISPDSVFMYGRDCSIQRFRNNVYFQRDQRWHGACTWNVICSHITADLWTPPLDPAWCASQIRPTVFESHVKTPPSLLDDYSLSLNIARFGLRYSSAADIEPLLKIPVQFQQYHHQYTEPPDDPKDADGLPLTRNMNGQQGVVFGKINGIKTYMRRNDLKPIKYDWSVHLEKPAPVISPETIKIDTSVFRAKPCATSLSDSRAE